MKFCELCGAEVAETLEACSRCGFVFQRVVSADVRDTAILKGHEEKSVETVKRDLRNARAKLSAYLDNASAKRLSSEELATLLDDALSLLRIPMFMGFEGELRFNPQESSFIRQVADSIDGADTETGSPVGTCGTYVRLGNALQAMGEPERAMGMIDKAILLNPRDRDAMMTRANLLFYAKEYSRARKCLEKILAGGEDRDARNLIELIEQIVRG